MQKRETEIGSGENLDRSNNNWKQFGKSKVCQVWQECILHLYLAGFVCDTNEIG